MFGLACDASLVSMVGETSLAFGVSELGTVFPRQSRYLQNLFEGFGEVWHAAYASNEVMAVLAVWVGGDDGQVA